MKKFLAGLLVGTAVLPLIDAVLHLVEQGTEYFCTKIAVKTVKLQAELQQEQALAEGGEQTFAIGFNTSPSVEEEYYDDEEDI